MVIRALDYVPQCYTQQDGEKVYNVIFPFLRDGKQIELSFDGVDVVPSSFVNTALIALLDVVSFDVIKRNLRFVNTTSQINEIIRNRFNFELNGRHAVH
jgi:hypothetical protein